MDGPSLDPRPGKGEATRHLSAAPYVDDIFRRRVIRGIVGDRSRATAPEFGVDPATIVAHCRRAGALRLFHASALLAVLVVFAATTPTALVWPVALGAVIALFQHRAAQWAAVVVGVLLLAPCVWAAAFEPTAVSEAVGVLMDAAREARFGLVLLTSGTLWLLAALTGVALVTGAIRTVLLGRLANGDRTARSAHPRFPADADLVIYSGTEPFAGSGRPLNEERLTVPLRPAADTATVGSFTAAELVDRLRIALTSLGEEGSGARRLPGLDVADQAFLPGVAAASTVRRLDEHFGRAETMAAVIERPSPGLRHFLRCQVIGWEGELVTTVYAHVSVEGEALRLEYAAFLLPPTRPGYQVFGARRRTGPIGFARNAWRAIAVVPGDAVSAPAAILGAVVDVVGRSARAGTPPGRLDRGARQSIREIGSGPAPPAYQLRDVLRQAEILERRVLTETAGFLAARGFDGTEFDRRAAAMTDHGAGGPGLLDAVTGPAD